MKESKRPWKYPVKLEIEAHELPNGEWILHYKEYFKKEDFAAFKNAVTLSEIAGIQIDLNEHTNCATLQIKAKRGRVFDFLCGEFFSLSNIAKLTLQDLFILRGITMLKAMKAK